MERVYNYIKASNENQNERSIKFYEAFSKYVSVETQEPQSNTVNVGPKVVLVDQECEDMIVIEEEKDGPQPKRSN